MNTTPIFRRVALIGFGLIGGSIARAARKRSPAKSSPPRARKKPARGCWNSASLIKCWRPTRKPSRTPTS